MKTILLVNPVKTGSEEIASILDRAEFRIMSAASGKEALRIHRREKVDLIVAGLDMSGMGGDELCSRVRKDGKLKNVSLLLICRDTPEDRERAARCGANAWITEPEQLFEAARDLLEVSARRSYRHIVLASVDCSMGRIKFFGTSENVSVSGMMIETDKLLGTGARINCSFFLPDQHKIEVNGKVVRSVGTPAHTYGYGIRFINVPPEFRAELERFTGFTGKNAPSLWKKAAARTF